MHKVIAGTSTSRLAAPRRAPVVHMIHPAAAGVERRRSTRLPLSASVHLVSRDNLYAGRARDISSGGLFIETSAAIDVGVEIGVRLRLLDETFAFTSEVVWALGDRAGRPVGVGVRFLHLSARLRDAIAAFMARRAPITFDVDPPGGAAFGPPPLPALGASGARSHRPSTPPSRGPEPANQPGEHR